MKIYNDAVDASFDAEKDQKFITKFCPFHVRMSTKTLCGSWCPHFFIEEIEEHGSKRKEIYITCSGAECLVGVEE